MSLIVGTRIHSDKFLPDLSRLENWCKKALEYSDKIILATDTQLFPKICQIVVSFKPKVQVLHVSPWNGFTIPLNAIVTEAVRLDGDRLLLQSFEVFASPQEIQILSSHLASDTLVVGAKLTKEHCAIPGVNCLNGMTSPWNTLALWNLSKLYVTGFLGISDGAMKNIPGGMEEVPTISVLQKLYPHCSHAKVINLSQVEWNILGENKSDFERHRQKIATKLSRAKLQLEHAKIEAGTVLAV